MKSAVAVAITAILLARPDLYSAAHTQVRQEEPILSQLLETPFLGQHVGLAIFDINNDGAPDVLFAAGRHWVDQSYALVNLGPIYAANGDFEGVRFSEALSIGPPGGYYQIDVAPSLHTKSLDDRHNGTHHTMVVLVGGTCHDDTPTQFGSCVKEENTPARLLQVGVSGCNIHNPDAQCNLDWDQVWEDQHPRGDRNGGFAYFQDAIHPSIALLGQGGVEIYQYPYRQDKKSSTLVDDDEFRIPAPTKTDPRSDYSRYAGFASSKTLLGGAIAAGRRSDFDPPQFDSKGHAKRLNLLVYKDEQSSSVTFEKYFLPSNISGEPYSGNTSISIQSTNFQFDDIDGDGVEDLLEATFLYSSQRVRGHPLPQRIHFLDEKGHVKETLVVHESDEGDAGRSVTTGQIFSDSALPDVVFASAKGKVTVFANLGVDEHGNFRGLEQRYTFAAKNPQCQVRDVAVARMTQNDGDNQCWIGLVAAVACPFGKPKPKFLGENEIFYIKGNCEDDKSNAMLRTNNSKGQVETVRIY